MKEGRVQGPLQLAQRWAQGSLVHLWQRTHATHLLLRRWVVKFHRARNSGASRVSMSSFSKEVIWYYATPSSLFFHLINIYLIEMGQAV